MQRKQRFINLRDLRTTLACLIVSALAQASAPPLSGAALVPLLQRGGYILVMRHASSPVTQPTQSTAESDNVKLERQLDDSGRSAARAWGEAIRKLRIPIGTIWSSPMYRAQQTIKLAALGKPTTVPELAEGALGMAADTDTARSAWLRHAVAVPPPPGTNTLVVTHTPNILAAFGQQAADVAAGESLVFRPDGKGAAALVARIKIDEWEHF